MKTRLVNKKTVVLIIIVKSSCDDWQISLWYYHFCFINMFLGLIMTQIGGVTGEQLRSFIERIEKLEQEKADLMQHIRDVYAEAKGSGYDAKIMRQIVRLRKMEDQARREQEELLDLYKNAVGL